MAYMTSLGISASIFATPQLASQQCLSVQRSQSPARHQTYHTVTMRYPVPTRWSLCIYYANVSLARTSDVLCCAVLCCAATRILVAFPARAKRSTELGVVHSVLPLLTSSAGTLGSIGTWQTCDSWMGVVVQEFGVMPCSWHSHGHLLFFVHFFLGFPCLENGPQCQQADSLVYHRRHGVLRQAIHCSSTMLLKIPGQSTVHGDLF